jgi:hypothetical protein
MQSNRTRAAALVAAIATVVVLFFALKGGGDSDISTSTTSTGASGSSVPTITIKGGQPEGGIVDLTYNSGDQVQFVVDSDTADEVHVHGYDIGEDVKAGGTVKFDFPADLEGVFEIELESSATQIAQLTVDP